MINSNNQTSKDVKLLLTIQEAAEALGISERKLWGMTFEERSIAHIKIGRLVRDPMAVLDSWVTLNTQGVADDE